MIVTRLLTRRTRPNLYQQLADQAGANDNRAAFRHAYRRQYPVLTFLAWIAESNWRVAGMIFAAFVIGSVIAAVLP